MSFDYKQAGMRIYKLIWYGLKSALTHLSGIDFLILKCITIFRGTINIFEFYYIFDLIPETRFAIACGDPESFVRGGSRSKVFSHPLILQYS